jgi:hypothetical protein
LQVFAVSGGYHRLLVGFGQGNRIALSPAALVDY